MATTEHYGNELSVSAVLKIFLAPSCWMPGSVFFLEMFHLSECSDTKPIFSPLYKLHALQWARGARFGFHSDPAKLGLSDADVL